MPSFATIAAAALAAIVPAVSAHGHISEVTNAAGKVYKSGNGWIYNQPNPEFADSVGWFAKNQDNGFVDPSMYETTSNLACHIDATVAPNFVEAKAGSTIKLQWGDAWPESHHGPVINSLARVNNGFKNAKAGDLDFFKISQKGLIDGSVAPGKWASDELIANGNSWEVKIPDNIQGDFVLRHEIIALHGVPQNYPQCINIKIAATNGNAMPCKENPGLCHKGKGLYLESKAGQTHPIYSAPVAPYNIPGPKGVFGKLQKRVAQVFKA